MALHKTFESALLHDETGPFRHEDDRTWMLFDELTTSFTLQEDGSTLLRTSYKWKGDDVYEEVTTLYGTVDAVSINVAPWRREVTLD